MENDWDGVDCGRRLAGFGLLMKTFDIVLSFSGAGVCAFGLTFLKKALAEVTVTDPFAIPLAGLMAIAGAGVIYFAGLAIGMAVMSRNQLSIAYPIFLGLSFVAMMSAAVIALGETVSLPHAIGAGLILAGAYCVSRSPD